MKKLLISLLLTGCATLSNPATQQAIVKGANDIAVIATAYNQVGSPGLPQKDQPYLAAGLAAGAAILQNHVGTTVSKSALVVASPAATQALQQSVNPNAVVTQADVNAVAAAAKIVK